MFAQQGGGPGGGGRGPGGGGGGFFGGGEQNQRYSLELFINASNPLNRVIETGYSGNLSVPSTFGRPTNVQQARRVNFGMSLRF